MADYKLVNPFDKGQDKPNPEVSETAPAVPTTERNATSDKQIEANARNAKSSTGPKTEAGKARSSQNATKYGFYQKELLPIPKGLMAEDQATIEEFIDGVVASLEPRDPAEHHVARQIAQELLRGARLGQREAQFLEQDGNYGGPSMAVRLFVENIEKLETLMTKSIRNLARLYTLYKALQDRSLGTDEGTPEAPGKI